MARVFAIYLHVDPSIRDRGDVELTSAQYLHPFHALQAVHHYAGEVPQVAYRILSLEQDHLELVIEQRSIARNLQVAAVVPYLAHECERALVVAVVNFYRKLLQIATYEAEGSYPVGHLAQIGLQRRAEVVDQASCRGRRQPSEGSAAWLGCRC